MTEAAKIFVYKAGTVCFQAVSNQERFIVQTLPSFIEWQASVIFNRAVKSILVDRSDELVIGIYFPEMFEKYLL